MLRAEDWVFGALNTDLDRFVEAKLLEGGGGCIRQRRWCPLDVENRRGEGLHGNALFLAGGSSFLPGGAGFFTQLGYVFGQLFFRAFRLLRRIGHVLSLSPNLRP